jgi:hypothetical protein
LASMLTNILRNSGCFAAAGEGALGSRSAPQQGFGRDERRGTSGRKRNWGQLRLAGNSKCAYDQVSNHAYCSIQHAGSYSPANLPKREQR